MARVKYGSIITEIRGKIGGTVFQSNRYGFSAKNSPCMIKPNSKGVFASQRILNFVTQSWVGLSASDRLAFETYAASYPQYSKHNHSAQLSGYAVYVMWQATLLNFGNPLGSIPSGVPEIFPTLTPSLTLVSPTVLNLDLGESAPGAYLFGLSFSPVIKASVNFPPSSCRFVFNYVSGMSVQNIFTQYSSQFGYAPPVGSFVFMRVIPYGQVTPQVQSPQFFKLEVV